jgi:hypothetical protein
MGLVLLAMGWAVRGNGGPTHVRAAVPTYLLPATLADGLAVLQSNRRACSTGSRPIELSTGPAEISVRDGYRIMYGYPGSGFFANVKVELSDPERFLVDERLARQQIWEIAQGCDCAYEVREHEGVNYSVLFHRNFGAGVLAMGVMSFPAEHTLVTAYLLDQEPGHRAFESIEEFRVLAERFFPNFIHATRTETIAEKSRPTSSRVASSTLGATPPVSSEAVSDRRDLRVT